MDPRAFVLHKWYVSQQPDREPAKRRRDATQARQMASLLTQELRHLPASPAISKLFPDVLLEQSPYTPDKFEI